VRSSRAPFAESSHFAAQFTDTITEGSIIGDHHPFRSSAGPRNEAKDEIVGAGGPGVPNGEPPEVFRIGRSDGRWAIKDYCQMHPALAYRVECTPPHAVPIPLVPGQTVEKVIAVDDDRHEG
jgi:hypothetical protein